MVLSLNCDGVVNHKSENRLVDPSPCNQDVEHADRPHVHPVHPRAALLHQPGQLLVPLLLLPRRQLRQHRQRPAQQGSELSRYAHKRMSFTLGLLNKGHRKISTSPVPWISENFH